MTATVPPPRLPDEAYAAALASLGGMGWKRMGRLLASRSARDALDLVRAGRVLTDEERAASSKRGEQLRLTAARWRERALRVDVEELWRRTRALGVAVFVRGRSGYPAVLADDPEPPAVVFLAGRMPSVNQRRVAIVGTRHCTQDGKEVARSLGYALAAAGVCVVSGLALGVDGAAHEGALAADAGRPFGVVASGVDVPYPVKHARLWTEVARAGGLLTEYPPGAPANQLHFPARNRLIAAWAEIVVVVESRATGGSRHTVDAAIVRDRVVMAVPGSIRNPAAVGTNLLIGEGCTPVCDVQDVLIALELLQPAAPRLTAPVPRPQRQTQAPTRRKQTRPSSRPDRTAGAQRLPDPPDSSRMPVTGPAVELLEHLDGKPTSLDTLLLRTGWSPLRLTEGLEVLRTAGAAVEDGGWWSRRG